MDQTEETPAGTTTTRSRPLVLSLLCMISFAFFATMSLLALVATVQSGTITGVMQQYLPGHEFTRQQITLLFSAILAAHLAGLTGTWLLWRLRRPGFILLSTICLAMATAQVFVPGITIMFTAVYIAFIFLFGFFFRRLS